MRLAFPSFSTAHTLARTCSSASSGNASNRFTQQRSNFQFCATCFGFSPSPLKNLRYLPAVSQCRGSTLRKCVHARARTHTRLAFFLRTGSPRPIPHCEHSPLHSAPQFFLSLCSSCAKDGEDRGRRMSCGERVAGDTRGLVGAMTLTSTQTELVPTVRTSAVTSLSAAQQDRGCTSLTSSSEADRSHPAPHALVVELKTSSVLLTNERAIDTSEVCSSASLSFHLWRSPHPALSLIRPLPPRVASGGPWQHLSTHF